jgi:hypothetical protein
MSRDTLRFISDQARLNRRKWISEIQAFSGVFSQDSSRLELALSSEIASEGSNAIVDHLRLCGDIPEAFGHDSTEEKLYSKYTDALLAEAYRAIGLKSLVIAARGDSADVEAVAPSFSFVADAKAMRLSRTAKNQKDFKVQAMDGWKRGKPYAMVVCPIYQLPNRSSQIYEQASARNVCVFTYSHLALLVSYSKKTSQQKATDLLHSVFQAIPTLNPSKDAGAYWQLINRTLLTASSDMETLWKDEKQAAIESLTVAKQEALTYLAEEREKIMRMTHEETLRELLSANRIDSRINTISSVVYNGLLDVA